MTIGLGIAHDRMTALVRIMLASPNKNAAQLAMRSEIGLASVEKYLRRLEADGRAKSRLETHDEAEARVARTRTTPLSRKMVRRCLLWSAVDAERGA
jgi:hypothetical protein